MRRKTIPGTKKLFLLVLFVSLFSVHLQAPALNINWDTLKTGTIVVEAIESDDGLPGVSAMFAVRASRHQIWKTLVDYKRFMEIFDGIERLEVLEENDKGAKVAFWIDAVLKDLHYVLYREYTRPGYELTWKRVSGDLKRINGSWLIEESPDPDQKVVVYRSFVKVGGIVPTALIRFGAMRRADDMCKKLRRWIESNR